MRGALIVGLALLASAPAGAGDLIFANGNRLAGDLSSETLMVSTGAGLVEVTADEVASLSKDEIRLRDGRVIRGTLIGGQIKARTSFGEIAVKVEELQSYQASEPSAQAAPSTPGPVATASPVAVNGSRGDSPIVGGLPTMAAYQEPTARQPAAAPVSVQTAVLTNARSTPPPGRLFEIVGESNVYRDALFNSSRIGHVVAGQQVRYVDSIDRRLRILNLLVFDGGHWVKIRLADGIEGWVPADQLREVQ
jgi:hypothetical protein